MGEKKKNHIGEPFGLHENSLVTGEIASRALALTRDRGIKRTRHALYQTIPNLQ